MDLDPEEFLREMDIMKQINHPNIVNLLGVCTQELPLLIIIEFMHKGNLLDYLRGSEGKNIEVVMLIYLAQQVALAMVYLESMRIVHRLASYISTK